MTNEIWCNPMQIIMINDDDKCLFKSVAMGFIIQFTMGNGQVDDT